MVQSTERADARANRARLIEAAHEVFRERGLGAEMKEIAERAGVGIGTIYRNFPSKDDLIAAIIGEAVARMRANLENALAIADPVEAVRAFLRGGFRISEQYGDVAMAVLEGNLPAVCKEQFKDIDRLDMLARLVRKGIDAGSFRADLDPEIAATALIGALMPWHVQRFRRTRPLDDLVDAHLSLFLNGVLAERP